MVMDWLFDWMIMVNLIAARLNIEKQVLANLKSVTGAEKIFFSMKTMFLFQESAYLSILILENLMFVMRHNCLHSPEPIWYRY
jgi:hypothetical protein